MKRGLAARCRGVIRQSARQSVCCRPSIRRTHIWITGIAHNRRSHLVSEEISGIGNTPDNLRYKGYCWMALTIPHLSEWLASKAPATFLPPTSSITVFKSMDDIRNNKSLEHIPELIDPDEERFIFDGVAAILRYIQSVDRRVFGD